MKITAYESSDKNLNENTPGRCMAAVVLEVVLSGAGFHDTPRQD